MIRRLPWLFVLATASAMCPAVPDTASGILPTSHTSRHGDGHAETLEKIRKQIATLVESLARDGLVQAVKASLLLYRDAGATNQQVEELTKKIEKALARKRRRPASASVIKRHAKLAGSIAAKLTVLATDGKDLKLVRLALAFDTNAEAPHRLLGHVKSAQGRWLDTAGTTRAARSSEMSKALARAMALPFPLPGRPAKHALLKQIVPERSAVEHEGLVIESHWPEEKLRAMFRDILRAMAYSNWLISGELKPHHRPGLIVHLPTVKYKDFLRAAKAAGHLEKKYWDTIKSGTLSYIKRPGARSALYQNYAVTTAGGLGEVSADIIQLYDASLKGWGWNSWFDRDPVVPIWATVGHLNFIMLSCLGCPMSNFLVATEGSGTVAADKQTGFELGRAGIVGCRSWLRKLASENRAPGLDTTMLDQVGKIVGVKRLKATSACELLHCDSQFRPFLESYRKLHGAKGKANVTVLTRSEDALKCSVPDFDARWREWILPANAVGVRGMLLAKLKPAIPKDAGMPPVVATLNRIRAAAHLNPVTVNAELSAGAEKHARYLRAHPERATEWPDMHEELTDLSGFSPAGAWAGRHSVLAFNGADTCVQEWMGTFYHRLPLVHPGLLQVGFGKYKQISVLDSGSLVDPAGTWASRYPFDGQNNVPRRFVPELPNPVPSREDQSTLGSPITLMLGPNWQANSVVMTLSLRGESVPCFYSTPEHPTNPRLSFDNIWCLIPKAPLRPRTSYVVSVTSKAYTSLWSFTTGES